MRRAHAAAPRLYPLRHLPWPQGHRGPGLIASDRAVCVFPGQGSQRVGMGGELVAQETVARETLAEADQALGFALSRLCAGGPADRLELTEYAQPAILAVSVALWRVLRDRTGLSPLAVAGHSLGEWTALVAAGAIAFDDAVCAVRERGRLMQAAVPVGEGAMAAVLGADLAAVESLCAAAAAGDVLAPANLNGGGQIVVAGHTAAVERLLGLTRERKMRAQRLAVSAPFHCPLMAPAARGLASWMEGIAIHAPALPVITSVDARPVRDAADVRDLLIRQVTAPVRWEDTARALAALEPTVTLEVGPGQALKGLFKRIAPTLAVTAVGDRAGLMAAEAALA